MVRNALSSSVTETLFRAANNIYQSIAKQGLETSEQVLLKGHKYLPHASSFSLSTIENKSLTQRLLHEIANGVCGDMLRAMLQSKHLLCDLDQAWFRRQYAPHLYPLEHAPHGWHQDGALGVDFLSENSLSKSSEGLLPAVTCWIALNNCGVNAPGLEFICQPIETLLSPNQLTEAHITQSFAADLFYQPVMEAGDGIVFNGGTLHRTHVMEKMRLNRTSLELRFVAKDNIPTRLQGDCFVPLPFETD